MTTLHVTSYALVSAICLLVHNGVIITMDAMGFPLIVGVLASFALVLVVGYLLHCLFTFRHDMSMRRFKKYAVAMVMNVPFSFVSIWLLNDMIGLQMVFASPIASAFMLSANYFLSRWAIAQPKKLSE